VSEDLAPNDESPARCRAFSDRETGFEPATARPPARSNRFSEPRLGHRPKSCWPSGVRSGARPAATRRRRELGARKAIRDGAVPSGYPAGRAADDAAVHTTAKRRGERGLFRESPLLTRVSDPFRSRRKWSPEPLPKRENRAVVRFVKPSAGLEPATPSLPWRSGCSRDPVQQAKVPGHARKWRSADTSSAQHRSAPSVTHWVPGRAVTGSAPAAVLMWAERRDLNLRPPPRPPAGGIQGCAVRFRSLEPGLSCSPLSSVVVNLDQNWTPLATANSVAITPEHRLRATAARPAFHRLSGSGARR
jgi:hypothetical protein